MVTARRAAVLAALGLVAVGGSAACASGGAGGLGGPRGAASLRRGDRVFITAMTDIDAVAVSQRFVFAASRGALAIYDQQFGSWYPPLTAAEGYPSGTVGAIAADPVEDGVWVGTFGAITYYRPVLDYATSSPIAGSPEAIVFDARDPGAGAYVYSGGAWWLVSRAGFVSQAMPNAVPRAGAIIRSPTLGDLYRQYPSLRNFQGLLTRDAQLQSWPVTSGSKAPDQSQLWLGTRGGGLFRVDPLFNRAEQLPFGLLEHGAGALARTPDGVWVAGAGVDPQGRGGLTLMDPDLRRWRWLESARTRPLAGARTYALSIRDGAAWVATERGAVRMETSNPDDIRVWSLGNGLPDDRATALATATPGVWVGTPRGLALIEDSAGARSAPAGAVRATLLSGVAVHALLVTGDTLWLGTDAGLLALARGDSAPRRPVAVGAEPRLRRPVVALARSDSVLVAATADEAFAISIPRGALLPRYDAVGFAALRGITDVEADERTIWVAGRGGVLVIQRRGGLARLLAAPGEVPDEAYDVVLEPEYGWVATRSGVLRLRRLSDGSVR